MKFLKEITALSWTLAGTGLVLITLAGRTRMIGVYISVIALGVHLAGLLIKDDDD